MSRISWVERPQEGGTEKQALREENMHLCSYWAETSSS